MPRALRSKQLPYLTEYVQYAMNGRANHWTSDLTKGAIALGFGLGAAVGCVSTAFVPHQQDHLGIGMLSGFVTFFAYMLGVYMITKVQRERNPDPEVALRREARQVAHRLGLCLAKKRLHRELTNEVSCLLEEASRNWHRARSALESPYWRRADLPGHLRAVRDQSRMAIDQGMQELLVLFSTTIPEKPGPWSFGEMVDELSGQDFFATRGRLDHISPFHADGVGVARKLLELADQVETVSRQLAGQELITGAPKPGAALEATLTELRSLKQAEEELQQDLRA